MLTGYIDHEIHRQWVSVSVAGLSNEDLSRVRSELATYYGWQNITYSR